MLRSMLLLNTIGSALGGTILWDGRFNNMTSSAELSDWSFSNPIGDYQYYIHGDSNVTAYVNLDSTFKNPADTGSSQGVKITLDSTAYWEGQTMRRTELIPQTSAAIGTGQVFYHFSMMRSDTNAPSENREHQIMFFESHFTEMKSGWQSGATGTSDPLLRWDVSSSTEWNTTWEADVWHNVAYGIDFSAGTVAFYHSTGADDLVLTVPAVACSASSNGADFHVGMLELERDGYTDTDEDVYFSGVYIESGDITLSIAGPGGVAAVVSSSASSTPAAVVPSSTQASVVTATSTAVVIPVAASSSVVSIASVAPTSAPVSETTTTSIAPIATSSAVSVESVAPTSSAAAIESVAPTTTTSSAPAETSAADGDDDDDEDCYEE